MAERKSQTREKRWKEGESPILMGGSRLPPDPPPSSFEGEVVEEREGRSGEKTERD